MMNPKLTDSEWKLLSDLFEEKYGLRFDGGRKQILESRLQSRLVDLHLQTFSDYYHYLVTHPKRMEEDRELKVRLTNNETYFLREAYQFELLVNRILPSLKQKLQYRPLRILSAACSSGEEVYSLSIKLNHSAEARSGMLWRIDACDIDPEVLGRAKEGCFLDRSFRGCPPAFRRMYFEKENEAFYIKKIYKKNVQFISANLLDLKEGGLFGPYDIVFCRNALIYFSDHAFHSAISNLNELMSMGGYLFLGHSESLIQKRTDFVPISFRESVIYQKVEEQE